MEQEEALRRMIDRGKIVVTPENRDAIAAAMAPLPPPWEWQHLREVADLTVTDMAQQTKIEHGRIRRWEKGNGTTDPRLWVEYATTLVSAVTSELQARDEASLIKHRQNGAISIQLSPGVERQLEMLHSTGLSLTMWAEGNGTDPVCSLAEASVVHRALRDAVNVIRKVQGKLKPQAGTGTGEQQ